MYMFSQVFAFASFASGAGLSTILWAILSILLLTAIVLKIFLKFKVSFKDSDNNSLIFEGEYKWLHKITASNASKNGKKFIGWSKSAKGGKCLDSNSFIVCGNTVLYAIWENSAEEINDSDAGVATLNSDNKGAVLELSYLDDGNNEISNESFSLDCKFPVVQKDGKEFLGWAFAPGAGTAYGKDCKDIYFVLRLYPVYSQFKPEGKENKTVNFELIFKDSYSGDEITKYSFDIQPNAPVLKDGDKVFVGWGVEPDSDTVIGQNVDASSVVVELFTSFKGDMPEEPVQEEVIEEPAQEEVIEEPAQEEVIEEPVQDDVVEEPVQEEVVEEPVQDEVVEEPVQEEVVEEPAQDEVVEEPAQDEVVEEPVEAYDANIVFVPTYFDSEGNKINIKYSRSVTANIIQSDDTVKNYYSELKNHILSYKGVKSRISWKFDSFNRGRDQLFKLKLRGKTVLLYCAIDPNDIDKSKYHHDAVDNKLFADVPTLLKVKSGLGLRKAKEIIDAVMAKFGIEKSDKPKTVNYVKKYPYEETEALLEKKLVKKLVSNSLIEKGAGKEEPQENNIVVEEIPAEVVEEPVQEEVVEEPVEEEVIEEPVQEEVAEEPAQEEAIEEELTVVESVDAAEADNLVSDKKATSLVEEDVEYISEDDFKKDIVNIDTLSENFNSGDVVTLKKLKEKKLVHAKTKFVKVLARGRIDKPLTVKAGEFSNTALKMILLTGGKAIHSRYEVK